MGRKRKYKAIVAVDFKIHENGAIIKYKKGSVYTSTKKTRIDNLKAINKIK
jgi:hypothetical protein